MKYLVKFSAEIEVEAENEHEAHVDAAMLVGFDCFDVEIEEVKNDL